MQRTATGRASRIIAAFGSTAAFATDLRRAVAEFSATLEEADGEQVVRIPGHRPFPTVRMRRSRLFSRRQQTLYEPVSTAIIDLLVTRLRPDAFFDIGASQGYFSLLALCREANVPEVHSFEMMPSRFERMTTLKRAGQYGSEHWHLHHAAIADRHEGVRRIYYSRTRVFESEPSPAEYREQWWRRVKFLMRGVTNRDRLQTADVLLTSVDAFTAETGVRPALMKVDIDGYEGRFLDGARDYLVRERPVILLEIHKDVLIRRTGTTRAEILARFFDLGYEALLITEHNDARLTSFVPLDRQSPELARQRTDQILLF